jgi:hypothetical protein
LHDFIKTQTYECLGSGGCALEVGVLQVRDAESPGDLSILKYQENGNLNLNVSHCVHCPQPLPAPQTHILSQLDPIYTIKSYFFAIHFHPLTPKGHYSGRTAPLTSRRCILNIYSTNIRTEYFKHAA